MFSSHAQAEMDFEFRPNSEAQERYDVLRGMREKAELCDIVLETSDGVKTNAHKCVLAATSPYFRAMFNTRFSEAQNGIIKLKDVNQQILMAIISYSYCCSFSFPRDDVLSLLIISDQYQLNELVKECSSYLQNHIDAGNVLSLIAYSKLHRCWSLYQSCTIFALNNFKEVSETDQFLRLPSADQLIDLLANNNLSVPNEEAVYSAVIKWVYYCFEERQKVFPNIMCHVRLPFVSASFLNNVVCHEPLMKHQTCQGFISEALLYKSSPEKRGQLKMSPRVHPRTCSGQQEVIVIVGGTNTHKNGTLSVDQYDVYSDTWSVITQLKNLRYGLAGCYHNGCIYISGGCIDSDNVISDDIDCYNIKNCIWSKSFSMIKPRVYHTMEVLYGLLYVIGGQTTNGVLSDVEYYDPTSNKWSIVSSMNVCRMYHGSTILNGKIYTVGGHEGLHRLSSVECYDPLLNQWSFVSSLPEPRSVIGVASIAGSIYVVGGYTGQEHVNEVLIYNDESNEWSHGPPMNVSRSAFGLVTCRGVLYAVGGFSGSLLKTMEYLTPGDKRWYNAISMTTERIHFSAFST